MCTSSMCKKILFRRLLMLSWISCNCILAKSCTVSGPSIIQNLHQTKNKNHNFSFWAIRKQSKPSNFNWSKLIQITRQRIYRRRIQSRVRKTQVQTPWLAIWISDYAAVKTAYTLKTADSTDPVGRKQTKSYPNMTSFRNLQNQINRFCLLLNVL